MIETEHEQELMVRLKDGEELIASLFVYAPSNGGAVLRGDGRSDKE